MEDMERYGDYNEVDEAPGGNKNPIVTLLKALIIFLSFAVVGILIFRVVLFNYYPKNIENIYYNDTLTDYYNATGGEIGAVTQTLRAPYDDPDVASFICDNLIVIEGAEQIQLSLRYNSSVFDTIKTKYGVELDPNDENLFSFKLQRVPFDEASKPYDLGTLDTVITEKALMYTYYKLVFDSVELLDDGEPDWIRLEVTLNGVPDAEPYYILIYERSEQYDRFDEYKLKGSEKP